jgi:hypothetical protein
MKYAVTLLLLCSYVSAKDKEIDLARFSLMFHVDSMARGYSGGLHSPMIGCVMGLTAGNHSYIVRDYNNKGCFSAGAVLRGSADNRSVTLIYEKKGKLKAIGYIIESESASFVAPSADTSRDLMLKIMAEGDELIARANVGIADFKKAQLWEGDPNNPAAVELRAKITQEEKEFSARLDASVEAQKRLSINSLTKQELQVYLTSLEQSGPLIHEWTTLSTHYHVQNKVKSK